MAADVVAALWVASILIVVFLADDSAENASGHKPFDCGGPKQCTSAQALHKISE